MNNTDATTFLSKDNVEMIWELIIDEEFTRDKTERQMMDMQKFFITYIREFYEKNKLREHDLMSLNKMFIETILQQMSKKTTNLQTPPIKLREPSKPQPITAEDIQASRMSDFEKQFAERQNEFSSSMALKVPEKPAFNDEMDKPIGEMEDLIARTLAQRNFDIEQIQQNVDKEKVKSFLTSQETSIKSEKGETQKNVQQILKSHPTYNVGENEVKYIQIGQDELPQLSEVIDLQRVAGERRQVSWADQENIRFTVHDEQQQEETPNIFSRLKMRTREKADGPLSPSGNVLETNLKPHHNYDEDIKMLSKKVDDLSKKMDEIFNFIKNANTNKIDSISI